MKKLIIGSILATALVVAGIVVYPKLRLSTFLDGKSEKVSRGDLIIPVSATGNVEPTKLIEIKSKASGEVVKINVVEGEMIKAGAVLVELDPIDENRNVERAEQEFNRATASLQQARIRLEDQMQNRPLDVGTAEQLLVQAKVQHDQAQIEFDKLQVVSDKTEIETRRVTAQLNSTLAMVKKAEIDLERARNSVQIAIDNAKQDVALTEAATKAAQSALDDARQRLKETTIIAPSDGMVYSIRVKAGEIVQSGKTSLTGGTALMYLADTSRMYVIAQVDEADIGSVRRIAPEFARPGLTRRVSDEELMASAPNPPSADPDDPAASKDQKGKARAGDAADGKTGDGPAGGAATDDDVAGDAAAVETADLVGQRVRVRVEAYREESFEGIIERILPEPVRVQNVITFNVRIRLLGQELQKLMGLEADVQFTADRVSNVLLVKNEALTSEGKEVFVFIPFRENPNDRLDEKKIQVDIGMTDGVFTHIREGLKEGDEVWIKRPQKTQREKDKESQRT